jgi:hypothetical protein
MNNSTGSQQSPQENGRSSQTRFGIDHADGKLVLGSVRIPFPRSRYARLGIGFALIVGGVLGFLPILGFWMLPLGFVVLSTESATVRRWRRRFSVWWARRRRS